MTRSLFRLVLGGLVAAAVVAPPLAQRRPAPTAAAPVAPAPVDPRVATLKALVDAGANVNLADRSGTTPLALARSRGHGAMVAILERAGAR